MSENTENTTEEGQEQFEEGLKDLLNEGQLTHTILEIWKELLSNIEEGVNNRITPAIANNVVGNWPKLTFKDVPMYWSLYHGYLMDLRQHLLDVIDEHPDCLQNIEDDVEKNRDAYLEVLFRWSNQIQIWDEKWDIEGEYAAAHLAAMADAAAFFVGRQGLSEHLAQPQVGFEYSDEDREKLQERLEEAAKERA